MDKSLRDKIVKEVLIRSFGQFKDRSLSRAEHLQPIRYPASREGMIVKGNEKK